MRMTEDEYKDLCSRMGKPHITLKQVSLPEKKESKYHNHKTTIKDPKTGEPITFDSKKEADYYFELLARERAGEVFKISRQVRIQIQEGFTDISGVKHRPITYTADFVYYERINFTTTNDGRILSEDIKVHVVDVKGLKTDVYRLKKKLLAYQGIVLEEV